MSEKRCAGEPAIEHIVGDYHNEASGLYARIDAALNGMGVKPESNERARAFISRIDDKTLLNAITVARSEGRVRTLKERFLDPKSRQYNHDPEQRNRVVEWIRLSPLRVNRLNASAQILNTTENILEFKIAMNEMFQIMNMGIVFVIPDPVPGNPIRGFLNEPEKALTP